MVSDDPAARDLLPDDVRSLLREHIESYDELETLLTLERLRGAGKTAEELSAATHVGVPLIERAVRSLEARRFVGRRASAPDGSVLGNEPRYFYAPATPELDCAVRALARAYVEQPIPIIKLMSENAIQRLRNGAARAFAEAFILQKGK